MPCLRRSGCPERAARPTGLSEPIRSGACSQAGDGEDSLAICLYTAPTRYEAIELDTSLGGARVLCVLTSCTTRADLFTLSTGVRNRFANNTRKSLILGP
jgi:hypothetical protein